MTGIDPAKIKAFYARDHNACAHAAIATVLDHYGELDSTLSSLGYAGGNEADFLYDKWGNGNGLHCDWGTGPWHVKYLLKEVLKFDTYDYCNGGQEATRRQIIDCLNHEYPTISLVSWAGINHGNPFANMHYIVLYGYDEDFVYCANVLDGLSNPLQTHDRIRWDAFLDAGMCHPYGDVSGLLKWFGIQIPPRNKGHISFENRHFAVHAVPAATQKTCNSCGATVST